MSKIKISALGGLAENGKNMFVVEVDDRIFILDAGLKYPEVDLYGIDAIIPNNNIIVNITKILFDTCNLFLILVKSLLCMCASSCAIENNNSSFALILLIELIKPWEMFICGIDFSSISLLT